MEYTIQKLASLAAVSTRTLRYYDQIGLLTPARVNSSGYRLYGREQVDRLQLILFYRELEMELSEIAKLMDAPDYDRTEALRGHMRALCAKRGRLDALISNIEKTLKSEEEGIAMSDGDKFEGFKRDLIERNERDYGEEVREKYGDAAARESNRKFMNLSERQYERMQQIASELKERLERAVRDGESPDGEEGRTLCALHREWLSFTWPQYTVEAHKGLTQMYLDDERFTAHYDRDVSGCAQFLRDAVHTHAQSL